MTGGASSPHISAYVVFGMLRAREAGIALREDALSHGLDYLNGALVASADLHDVAGAKRQVWLLYMLAEAERPDASRLVEPCDSRGKLGTYARAYLVMALQTLTFRRCQASTCAGIRPGEGRLLTIGHAWPSISAISIKPTSSTISKRSWEKHQASMQLIDAQPNKPLTPLCGPKIVRILKVDLASIAIPLYGCDAANAQG